MSQTPIITERCRLTVEMLTAEASGDLDRDALGVRMLLSRPPSRTGDIEGRNSTATVCAGESSRRAGHAASGSWREREHPGQRRQ